MAFIEPLSLQTWILNVFAGDVKYFTAIAILFILMLAGYFRMIGMTFFLMLVIFFVIFKGYVDQSVYFLIMAIGSLLIGYWLSKIVK